MRASATMKKRHNSIESNNPNQSINTQWNESVSDAMSSFVSSILNYYWTLLNVERQVPVERISHSATMNLPLDFKWFHKRKK